MKMKILSHIKRLTYLLTLLFILCPILTPTAAKALSAEDLHTIYNDSSWYKLGGLGLSDSSICGSGPGTPTGSIELLMQVIAKHESGGDPTASNSGGGAYGKYQMISDTWDSRAGAYDKAAGTNFVGQYAEASNAPEAVQDAVQYIYLAKESIKWNGSVFRIAVDQYWPVANSDYSQLDIVPLPQAGNTETVREFANTVVDWYNSRNGVSLADYKGVQGFEQASSKTGQPKTLWAITVPKPEAPTDQAPAGGATRGSCSCTEAMMATAKLYAWPTYRGSGFITMKPEYEAAIKAAQARGEYVGVPAGIDCGGFVTRVMRDSSADKNYNAEEGNTYDQKKYMDDNPDKYQNLGTKTSTADLQPGDIAITANTHTYMFTGDQGFNGYDSVSASQGDRAPMASNAYFVDTNGVPFTWYRLKCNSNTTIPGGD
jgi:hypothetical protein